MSGRIDLEATGATSEQRRIEAPPAAPVGNDDGAIESLLPADHPAWTRDRLSLSAQARALLATLKPIAVRVLTFWDHRVRSAFVGGRRLLIAVRL